MPITVENETTFFDHTGLTKGNQTLTISYSFFKFPTEVKKSSENLGWTGPTKISVPSPEVIWNILVSRNQSGPFHLTFNRPFSKMARPREDCKLGVQFVYNKSGRDPEKIDFCNFCRLISKCHITVVSPFVMLHQRKIRTFDFTVFPRKES